MTHELKTWPQYFCRVKDGTKTFEVRNNDRGFQYGDTVILKEWDPEVVGGTGKDAAHEKGYTEAEPLQFKIGYVFTIDHQTVVFSLLPKDEK